MTLSFSTKINEKPNYFVEKIWKALIENKICSNSEYSDFLLNEDYEEMWDVSTNNIYPKLHTIRKDQYNRWRATAHIHPIINNRKPNRFQFAPVIECVSVQKIKITDISHRNHIPGLGIIIEYPVKDQIFKLYWSVEIDGVELNEGQIKKLAINDGFETAKEFFDYFNQDFYGKIIHWTNFKY